MDNAKAKQYSCLMVMAFAVVMAVGCRNGQSTELQTVNAEAPTERTAEVTKVNTDSLRAEAERMARMEEETKVIEKLVAEVYRQVDVAYRSSPVGKSIDLDGLYCTADWIHTVDVVREQDAKRQDEPGFFEADYWVMGQDVAGAITATDIVVDSLDMDEGKAIVSLHLHNGSGDEPLLLDMVREKETWRIDDFTTLTPDTFAWKVAMKEYLEGR